MLVRGEEVQWVVLCHQEVCKNLKRILFLSQPAFLFIILIKINVTLLIGSLKNEDCYIYTPSGEELRSSYDLLNYIIQHPEYWNSFDPLEINFSGL